MVVTRELRSLILRKASGDDIAAAAVEGGMRRLQTGRAGEGARGDHLGS